MLLPLYILLHLVCPWNSVLYDPSRTQITTAHIEFDIITQQPLAQRWDGANYTIIDRELSALLFSHILTAA
jgi:hypothetical protein